MNLWYAICIIKDQLCHQGPHKELQSGYFSQLGIMNHDICNAKYLVSLLLSPYSLVLICSLVLQGPLVLIDSLVLVGSLALQVSRCSHTTCQSIRTPLLHRCSCVDHILLHCITIKLYFICNRPL